MYRFDPVPPTAIEFDAKLIFERFAGEGMWSKWIDEGNVIIPNIFSYLVDSLAIFSMIEAEFDMYQHHYNPDQEGTMGWLRIMYYSLTQQVIRQDPVYYALTVASRPDKNWRLISYPYYTKDTNRKGLRTGFRHFDLSVSEFLKTGKGGNIVQGCVYLDNETDKGCTIVVPGFHRHIDEWWAEVTRRKLAKGEQPPNGETTNIPNDMYTAQDRKRFGEFMPCPCERGGIRITRPEIAHGSTEMSEQRRRLVFPWFTGIQEDHEELDNKESEKQSDLADFHRRMVPCLKSPSGRSASAYGRPAHAFAAAVKLSNVWSIGDATIGEARYDKREVIETVLVLLGEDKEHSIRLKDEVRRKLVEKFEEKYLLMKELEKKCFGPNSFFGN